MLMSMTVYSELNPVDNKYFTLSIEFFAPRGGVGGNLFQLAPAFVYDYHFSLKTILHYQQYKG